MAAVKACAYTIRLRLVVMRATGIDQLRVVPVPAASVAFRVLAVLPNGGERGAVVLEVLAAVAVLDLHLDPTDGAGGDPRGAGDRERRVVGDDPALDRAW